MASAEDLQLFSFVDLALAMPAKFPVASARVP